ncbi:hypothetical protein EV421DRAFT_2025357 [Armillaria borealis]|uniref:Uncharacterized protein n=1 Tax=Armillaria borealis TaxID=47425 RepID=A0AA39ITD2_9AGAR|nr:hypothetical protein EV421DRAFT_2025357 [Armillaria borealis]
MSQLFFILRSVPHSLQGRHLPLATDTIQSDGTPVTFPTSGEYIIEATNNQTGVAASVSPQIFEVGSTSQSSIFSGVNMNIGVFFTPFLTCVNHEDRPMNPHRAHHASIMSLDQFFQSNKTVPPQNQYKALQLLYRTTPPWNRYKALQLPHLIGSLVSLLLILGGGTFLFICKRSQRTMKYRPSPNLKMIPELNLHSPPVRNKNSLTIAPMLAGGVAPDLGDRSQEIVEQNSEGNPTEDVEERRNSISSPVHVDASEPQGVPQQEVPQAALDVVAEVVMLRTQFQQFIVEREAERVHGNVLDPPPAYT